MGFNSRFPSIVAAVADLPVASVILDGELVANNAKGMPEFCALHGRRALPGELSVWAFDILNLDGVDLRPLPLVKRRAKLERLLAKAESHCIHLSEIFADPERLLSVCNEHKLEGIVSKRADRPYTSGPSKYWIKVKCQAWREVNRERHNMFE